MSFINSSSSVWRGSLIKIEKIFTKLFEINKKVFFFVLNTEQNDMSEKSNDSERSGK